MSAQEPGSLKMNPIVCLRQRRLGCLKPCSLEDPVMMGEVASSRQRKTVLISGQEGVFAAKGSQANRSDCGLLS